MHNVWLWYWDFSPKEYKTTISAIQICQSLMSKFLMQSLSMLFSIHYKEVDVFKLIKKNYFIWNLISQESVWIKWCIHLCRLASPQINIYICADLLCTSSSTTCNSISMWHPGEVKHIRFYLETSFQMGHAISQANSNEMLCYGKY